MLEEALNNKITLKTFVIQDQQSQFSQVVLFPIDFGIKELDLQQLLRNKIPNYKNCKFRIYDFNTNEYVSLEQVSMVNYKIPISFIFACTSVVLMKYKKINSESGNSLKQTFSQSQQHYVQSQSSSMKKERAKQRMIAEVIQIVKRWRDLHIQKRGQKKISLQQAAKVVGLPKKSLDDYYYQLRLGEKYGFDFKTNFYSRIGVLRNFLKQKKPRLKSQKSDKHPKNLKIIQNFQQMKMISVEQGMDEQEIAFNQEQISQGENQNGIYQEQDQLSQMKIQNQFYEDFGFLESHQDPFVNLDGNFKKKKLEKRFDDQFFF